MHIADDERPFEVQSCTVLQLGGIPVLSEHTLAVCPPKVCGLQDMLDGQADVAEGVLVEAALPSAAAAPASATAGALLAHLHLVNRPSFRQIRVPAAPPEQGQGNSTPGSVHGILAEA